MRDGLKPVHRRILHGMNEMGWPPTGPRKSAKIVGEIMGNYHPHGDSAIYDTLVRMAQNFNMRYMLVDGQGNYGRWTAMRRRPCGTPEAWLTKLAEELLADIEKKRSISAPTMTSRASNHWSSVPGAESVGQRRGRDRRRLCDQHSTHNLGRSHRGLLLLLENPEVTIAQLMKKFPAPTFRPPGSFTARPALRMPMRRAGF